MQPNSFGSAGPAQSVGPVEIVDRAMTESLTRFLMFYGDTLLLLIRLTPDAIELESSLAAQQGGNNVPVKPSAGMMGFHTEVYSEARFPSGGIDTMPTGMDERSVAALLSRHRHFVVPLRKRDTADAMYAERISVGRARNKDIVLRHSSVSKFHGWFELSENNTFHYSDAGSRNGTRLNGQALPSRELAAVEHGDELVFGKIVGTVCSPEVFHKAMRLG